MRPFRGIPRSVRRVLSVLVIGAVVEYLVLPELAGAGNAIHLLAGVSPLLLLAGAALEAGSLASYFQLTRSLLPLQGRPSFLRTARIELSTLAVSHLMPGGNAAAGALSYQLFTEAGAAGTDVGFALATQGIGSAVVLNAMLWMGLVASIPARGFQPVYTAAAAIGVVVFGASAVLVFMLTKQEARVAVWLCRVANLIPILDCAAVERVLHRVAVRSSQLTHDRKLLANVIGWAAANWVLDAASLWVFIAAFGHRVGVDGLLVGYGLANVLAVIPITPGGLGIVEGVLTPTLVGFGVPSGVALLGVVSWRLVNFWAPIPAGGAAYLSLRLEQHRPVAGGTGELTEAVERAQAQAESPRDWAAEHGLRLPGKPAPPGRGAKASNGSGVAEPPAPDPTPSSGTLP